MTEQQRQERAAFIREQPGLCLFVTYAVAFVGCAVASDALHWLWGGASLSRLGGYLLPLSIAVPIWVGIRGWAHSRGADLQGGTPSLTRR
jgi:hypothetical protein